MKPMRIGLIGYDGVQALDLVGPLEAFMAVHVEGANGAKEAGYETVVIGLTAKPFVAETGLLLHPHVTIQDALSLDTVIIPGGRGLRSGPASSIISDWVKQHARRIRRIASVCTGVYGLAPTGLLDGRSVSTHWRFTRDLATQFPELRVDANSLYIKDGKFYTSAGITAGIDLSLAMIEEDYGRKVALAVARELVVYLKRPGGQEQFSEPLQFQMQSTDSLTDLAVWIASHLNQDLSIDVLAERACLCPRHFTRRFKQAFGTTPAAFVEDLRLTEARQRLARKNLGIDQVAASIGFRSAKAFRRAFERRFGVNPSNYQQRFATHSNSGKKRK